MLKFKIIELTKDNQEEYIDQVATLEEVVLEAMEKDGRIGQLFITGKEDIQEYIFSENNTVMVAIDNDRKVQSATYITQGQRPFTYNDITKYFKYGDSYKAHIRAQYETVEQYRRDLLDIYRIKIQAYKYAKRKVLGENPEYKGSIKTFLSHELRENEFHEKSILRENINRYMAEYIEIANTLIRRSDGKTVKKLYDEFYWLTLSDIEKEFGRKIDRQNAREKDIAEYEELMEIQEYEEVLKKGKLQIYEEPLFQEEKYYTANTENSIEIDTYITNPTQRHAGVARQLVYEGIKKHIRKHFSQEKSNELFLCSTLHRDNLSSKYVSEFFGLKDQLFVKRRMGRDREVHICRIGREEAEQYLNSMQNKLAVLYGYNPENKDVPLEEQKQIIKEQLEYEKQEYGRLNAIRHNSENYTGNVRDIRSKAYKIIKLKDELKKLEAKNINQSDDWEVR